MDQKLTVSFENENLQKNFTKFKQFDAKTEAEFLKRIELLNNFCQNI